MEIAGIVAGVEFCWRSHAIVSSIWNGGGIGASLFAVPTLVVRATVGAYEPARTFGTMREYTQGTLVFQFGRKESGGGKAPRSRGLFVFGACTTGVATKRRGRSVGLARGGLHLRQAATSWDGSSPQRGLLAGGTVRLCVSRNKMAAEAKRD